MPSPREIASGLFTIDGATPCLRAGRCAACDRLSFPAAPGCPYCGHDSCDEALVGRSGSLYLYTTIGTRPPGYRGPVPYGFGVVELPEGLRVVTRLAVADTTTLSPGLPMRLVVEPLFADDDGTPVLSWAYAPEAS